MTEYGKISEIFKIFFFFIHVLVSLLMVFFSYFKIRKVVGICRKMYTLRRSICYVVVLPKVLSIAFVQERMLKI